MKSIGEYISTYRRSFMFEMLWDVAVRDKAAKDSSWTIMPTKKRYFNADPFLFEKDGVTYLFYERYDRNTEIGDIACRVVKDDLTFGEEISVLKLAYHLSFPNVFEYNGKIYMIPETSANGTIEVYQAENFPSKWKHHKTICNGISAADTIVVDKQANSISILTSRTNTNPREVENVRILCKSDFSADKIILDKEMSDYGNRNAGNLIVRDGITYRVGQDCTQGSYGKGLVFYKRNQNTEEEVNYLGIDDLGINREKYSGVHTYNSTDRFEVVDLRYITKRSILQKIRLFIRMGKNYVKRRICR